MKKMIINNTMLILNPFIGTIVEHGKIINIVDRVDRVDKVYKVNKREFCRKITMISSVETHY